MSVIGYVIAFALGFAIADALNNAPVVPDKYDDEHNDIED
jgi:hypothetical protein